MKLLNLPNILTLGNLFCGCMAIFTAFSQELDISFKIKFISLFVFLSLLLDFLNGFVARAMNIKSDIGRELDSLADVVSFGVVPSCIMLLLFGEITFIEKQGNEISFNFDYKLFALLIALFSALRLAKFNLDHTQTKYFKGLATPANTVFILSLALTKFLQPQFILASIFSNHLFLLSIVAISCLLLISDIPMFSFKMDGFGFKKNNYRYIFLFFCLPLLILFKYVGLFFIMLLYILLSILFKDKITTP